MSYTNLIITGGINHDFVDTSNALKSVLEEADVQSIVFDNIDAAFESLNYTQYDLITINTLRWRMLDDDKYIPHREEWAYEIGPEHQAGLIMHLASGGGLLGLHTAAICFDTWQEWPSILGARWVWGDTFHPPPAPFTIQDVAQHPTTRAINEFDVVDEIYHNIKPHQDAELLFSTTSAEDNSTQGLAWAHQYSDGRVIYSSLGHDRASVETPGHKQFLQQAARWCAGDNP